MHSSISINLCFSFLICISILQGKTYTALKLTQPDTIIILRHRIYERLANRWTEAASEEFEAVVNRGSAKMETIDKRQVKYSDTFLMILLKFENVTFRINTPKNYNLIQKITPVFSY